MAGTRLVNAARVEQEVAAHHELLARWLRGEADSGVFEAFRAAHTEDFSLVTVDGAVVSAEELFAGLRRAKGARPGLRITVRDVEIVWEATPGVAHEAASGSGGFALVRFTERHDDSHESTSRVVSALLRADSGTGLRWFHVHETNR